MVSKKEAGAPLQTSRTSFETSQVGGNPNLASKPASFLNPVGETAGQVPPKAIGAKMEVVVFVLFVLVRAIHPVVVTESKTKNPETGDMEIPYELSSPGIAMTFFCCICSFLFCWVHGGRQQFMSIFDREPFIIFTINGALFALGDFLEMSSLGGLPAATYQILQQSRIIVTALLLIPAKNQYQTRLQWTILFILMFGMSTYMCISSAGKKNSGGNGDVFVGTMFALAKVLISCLGAVMTDKYTKKYKNDPTHVCIARTFALRPIFTLLLSFIPRLTGLVQGQPVEDIWSIGLFHGWNATTVLVFVSFIVKSVSGIYFVALLDSILKGIAESCAVLLIYGYDVLAPWMPTSFDSSTFMAVLVVVAACAAYIDSKAAVDKASKYDAMQAAGAATLA